MKKTLVLTLSIGLLLGSTHAGSSRPTDPFFNFKEFVVDASKSIVDYVKRPLLGHRPPPTKTGVGSYKEPQKPTIRSTTRVTSASTTPKPTLKPYKTKVTPKGPYLTLKPFSVKPYPVKPLPLKPLPAKPSAVKPLPIKPFVHFSDVNLAFSKPSTISFFSIATEKPKVSSNENIEKLNEALVKLVNVLETVDKESNELFEQLETLMKEMLEEKEPTDTKSQNNLKLMEQIVDDITEEMVITVRAHLAEVSAIEKLEHMKKLIEEIAQEGNNDAKEKLEDIEEVIENMQNADKVEASFISEQLENMKALIEDVKEETKENQDDIFVMTVALNKLEQMDHMIEELEENTLEDLISDIGKTDKFEATEPEDTISVEIEELEKIVNELSDDNKVLKEETKNEVKTLEKLSDMMEIIKKVALDKSTKPVLDKKLQMQEKVEEIKEIVKEISFRTKENLGGKDNRIIEEMKMSIGKLEKVTLELEKDCLTDEKLNDVKEIIIQITDSEDGQKENYEVEDILDKLEEMSVIVQELMDV